MAGQVKKLNKNSLAKASSLETSKELKSLSLEHLVVELENNNKKNAIIFMQLYFYVSKDHAKSMVRNLLQRLEEDPAHLSKFRNIESYFINNQNNKILLLLIESFGVSGTLAITLYFTMYKRWLSTATL